MDDFKLFSAGPLIKLFAPDSVVNRTLVLKDIFISFYLCYSHIVFDIIYIPYTKEKPFTLFMFYTTNILFDIQWYI
jgi:hypothetical protein